MSPAYLKESALSLRQRKKGNGSHDPAEILRENSKLLIESCQFSVQNQRALIVTVCEFVAVSNAHCMPRPPLFKSLVETQIKDDLWELLKRWMEQTPTSSDPTTAATA